MSTSLPKGFVPVMLTAFHADNSVDYEGIKRLTNLYIDAGAAGLFANCLSSEMYELTPDERLEVVKTVVETTRGRVPIVATGTLQGSVEEMAAFSKKLYATGIDAIIVINSVLVKPDDDDTLFLEKMHQFMKLTAPIPVGIYECPVPYKRLINKEILLDLLPSRRLIYHKDTSLDIDAVKERIATAESYTFGLYDAYMVNAVASLKAGAAGLSCIQGNYFPELIVWLCQNFDNEAKQAKVTAVQNFLTQNMDIMHAAYPISAKYVLRKRGFNIALATRREVGELTNEIKKGLNKLLADYEQLWEEVK